MVFNDVCLHRNAQVEGSPLFHGKVYQSFKFELIIIAKEIIRFSYVISMLTSKHFIAVLTISSSNSTAIASKNHLAAIEVQFSSSLAPRLMPSAIMIF